MKRGDLYKVYRSSKQDPKDYRVFMEAVNIALRIALATG
jgi:hypothetical protein